MNATRRRHSLSNEPIRKGFTRTDFLVLAVAILGLAALAITTLEKSRAKAARINCVNQLKQIGLSFRLFTIDEPDLFLLSPSSETPEGASAQVAQAARGAFAYWPTKDVPEGISLEPGAGPDSVTWLWHQRLRATNDFVAVRPSTLHCPADTKRRPATEARSLTHENISYLINLRADETIPRTILAGDRNLQVNGTPVGPGIISLPNFGEIGWTDDLHGGGAANITLADGSVQQSNGRHLLDQILNAGATRMRLLAVP